MKNVLNIGLRLTLIAVLAAAALGFTNYITKGPIEEQRRITKELTMAQVLPEADRFDLICSSETGDVPAEWQDMIVEASAGYAVAIRSSATPSPRIRRDSAARSMSWWGSAPMALPKARPSWCTMRPPVWGRRRPNPSSSTNTRERRRPLSVVKSGSPGEAEIQAITGATITSRAVTDAVNNAAAFAAPWRKEVTDNEASKSTEKRHTG